jgi:hypothetical protein
MASLIKEDLVCGFFYIVEVEFDNFVHFDDWLFEVMEEKFTH